MNVQRIPGRRLAAWAPAATLALVLAVLPIHPALAAPASPDEPLGTSITALWERLSGWLGLAPELSNGPERLDGSLAAPGSDLLAGAELDESSATQQRADGEDGYKLDPSG